MPCIQGLALYEVTGRRDAVAGPTANAGVRPAEVRENVLLLLGEDGSVGVAMWSAAGLQYPDADLGWLAGQDPSSLFLWCDGRVTGYSAHAECRLRQVPPIDIALLDLLAQHAGVPLWRLLGEEQRERVPAYTCSVRFEDLVEAGASIDSVVLAAQRAVCCGHRALKLHVGRGRRWMEWPDCTERDVAVCRAVRRAVGPDVTLMVDGGGGYGDYVDDAVDFIIETAACRLVFAQDLVSDEWLPQLHAAMIERGVRVPLASGVSLRSLAEYEALYSRAPVDVLLVDVALTGLLEARSIAGFAAEHDLSLATYNGADTQLGVYVAAHLGRVATRLVGCATDDMRFDDYSSPGFELVDGEFVMPDMPGLGVRAFDPRCADTARAM
jgi:L-alanine-DL-glutamate epimerase-like enolase superfamily enzyme